MGNKAAKGSSKSTSECPTLAPISTGEAPQVESTTKCAETLQAPVAATEDARSAISQEGKIAADAVNIDEILDAVDLPSSDVCEATDGVPSGAAASECPDLDAILDESLFEAHVGEELFPICEDCSCCQGYIFACKCSHSPSARVKCTQCSERFMVSGTRGESSRRAVAAAASAVRAPEAPAMSRAPSASARPAPEEAPDSGTFEWSVRVYPQLLGMPPHICKMLLVPLVVKILAKDENGAPLSWPDRGWGQQSDFDSEMEAAFSGDGVETVGVIIARALNKAEATHVCSQLTALSVHTSMVHERAPRLASGVGSPPDRAHLEVTSATGHVPELSSLEALRDISVAADEKVFHVALYLPDGAPATESSRFTSFVDSFLESSAPAFLRVLGAPDPENGHSGAYSWPERGWAESEHFSLHTQASMRRYGNCILARKLTFGEAYVIHKRLEAASFRSAVLLLGNEASLPTVAPQCTNGHSMTLGGNPSSSPPWQLSCDMCRCNVSDSSLYSCRGCDQDFCRACACIKQDMPCRIILGHGAGETVPFPPQEAGNEALAPGIPDLSNLLRRMLAGSTQNSKPCTKQSVIDALETKTFGSDDMFEDPGSTCAICLNEFMPGDKLTQLSCKHCFHITDHKDANGSEVDCEGIIPWLKKNNDCPMCRCQFPTEASTDASDSWRCPGCREERTEFSCERCGIRRNVIIVASSMAAPLFEQVEALFFECINLHQNKSSEADPLVFAAEQRRLTNELSDIMGSSAMQALVAANWRIKNGVKFLLEAAINGNTTFSLNFGGEVPDAGTMALYSILVDRLQAKVAERNLGAVLERPNLTELYGRTDWTCPLCCTSNHSGAEQCSSCRANYFVVELSKGPDVKEVFGEAMEYFFEGIDIRTRSDFDEATRQAALLKLKSKTDDLLSSDALKRLEDRKWQLRIPLAYLFAEIYARKSVLSFHVPDVKDINSCAIYAIFVRQIIEKQQFELEDKPQYGNIVITPPFVPTPTEDDYEPFESQKNYVNDNVKGFLLANKKVFMVVAQNVYEGFDGNGWDAFFEVIFPQFATSGWILGNAIKLMKRGVRDLDTITNKLDGGSAAVVEAILRVVLRHEAFTVIPSGDDSIPDIGPPLRRQVSVGTSSRNSMEHLRDRLADDALYKKVLKFLIRTLTNLQSDQSNIEYRRLSKESKSVIDLVVSHPEAVSVLQFVGFVEEEHLFRLKKLNRDAIIRTANVLKELAASVGLELF